MKDPNYVEIAQYLRFHMVPVEKPAPADKVKPKRARVSKPEHPLIAEIKEIGRPYEGFCLTLDCETTIFEGQKVRFGIYQIRGILPERRLELAKRGKLTRPISIHYKSKAYSMRRKISDRQTSSGCGATQRTTR